jgi:hypothetical protein
VNVDPVLAQFIITAIVAVPVYFKMRSEWRKATAEADSSSVKDALDLKREYKADMAALELKYEALLVKFDKLQNDLQNERAARAADKIAYEAEIAKLRMELHNERSARGLLETSQIESQRRIKELESNVTETRGSAT